MPTLSESTTSASAIAAMQGQAPREGGACEQGWVLASYIAGIVADRCAGA